MNTSEIIKHLVFSHREEISKQLDDLEDELNANLEIYEASLVVILTNYNKKREDLYHRAVAQLMIAHTCHKPEISSVEIELGVKS
jgi:hypothetical protein